MFTNLYICLKQRFDSVIPSLDRCMPVHMYILPVFGREFCIQESMTEFKLIYKGEVISTYSNTQLSIECICDMLYACILSPTYDSSEMLTSINGGEVVWCSRSPFSTGTLHIEEEVYKKDMPVGGEYINTPLTASEVAEVLFKHLPHLPLICFRYGKLSFIYINKSRR